MVLLHWEHVKLFDDPKTGQSAGLVTLQEHKTRHRTKRPRIIALPGVAARLLMRLKAEKVKPRAHVSPNGLGGRWTNKSLVWLAPQGSFARFGPARVHRDGELMDRP